MRVLGLETSSRRGSVALLEDERCVLVLSHEQPSSHAELMLPLVSRALSESGFAPSSLDRIVVGCGPGSFVGIRTGIALAQGLSLGLDRPVVGVGSLSAMLFAARDAAESVRVALLDARRDEYFVSAARADGSEVVAARAVPRAELAALIAGLAEDCLLLGEAAPALFPGAAHRAAIESDLPYARAVAELGRTQDPGLCPALPVYVRSAGATAQNLPPSPFAS